MKRNLSLLGILIFLLLCTWWFQERGSEIEQFEREEAMRIFNPEEQGGLLGLSFDKVKFTYDEKVDAFYIGEEKILAHPVRMQEVFDALDGLALMRVLDQEEVKALSENLAFPESSNKITFTTAKGNTDFVIGARLATDANRFYGRLANKVIVLEDQRPLDVAYQDEDEGNLKEQRLRTLFSLAPDFFYDTRLFADDFHVVQAAFDNHLVRPFEVMFENKITSPKPEFGIGYDLNEFEVWRSALEGLEAQTLYPSYKKESLKKYRGQLRLKDADNKSIELSLFGEYGPLKGDFVISSDNSYLYELGDNSAGIFFQNVQDFWDISLLKLSGEFELRMSDGNAKYQIDLIPGNVFNVRVKNSNKEARRDRFAVFHAMLTGRASYVSSIEDVKSAGFKALFNLQVGPRALSFGTIAQEWVIIDEANTVAYHYKLRDYPDLPTRLDEFFGTK